jgi:hypothetical protein
MMARYGYLLLLCGSLFASDIDELVSKIMTTNGIAQTRISAVKDPFEKEMQKDSNNTPIIPTEPVLLLKAVMVNEALVNNKWYKVGDKIEGYTLEWVEKNRVGVAMGKKQKTLYIFKGLK